MTRPPQIDNEYQRLCRTVFERDGWRCQQCGARNDLHVHHKVFRSHGGTDSADNLILLCACCHRALHGQRGRRRSK